MVCLHWPRSIPVLGNWDENMTLSLCNVKISAFSNVAIWFEYESELESESEYGNVNQPYESRRILTTLLTFYLSRTNA